MNERIRELSKQADEYARKHIAECNHYGYHMEHDEYEQKFQAKFAELIVRECAHYAFSDDQDRLAMLEHFGVE